MSPTTRRLIWGVLVFGCAVPVLLAIWDNLSTGGRVAAFVGIAAWVVLMAVIEKPLTDNGSSEARRSLMISTAVFMAVEWIGLLAFSREFLFFLYVPAIQIATSIPFVPESSDFGPSLVLTLACGAQALVCVLGLQWIGGAFRKHTVRIADQ